MGNLLVGYVAALWPAAESGLPRIAVITAFMAALTFVLVAGIRQTALISGLFTMGKLLLLGGFVLFGLAAVNSEDPAILMRWHDD